ncbi:MAG: LacI family DNA-binding transcriptional regulator [Ardenticatenaceae bacterium]|nr:LacI family DNA-binding transcriptional regulator [Ardenticatenaceae bacterium]
MPRVTLKDVAAEAGVSYQTVSKVINGKAQVTPETEERIRQVIQNLKYRPNAAAQNLRTQASNQIGYAWHTNAFRDWHPIHEWFLHSMTGAAEAHNYFVTVFNSSGEVGDHNIRPYADLFARQKVDGFVVSGTTQDDPRIAYLIEEKIPFVAFGRSNQEWDFCWVDVDGRYGVESVLAHLTAQGHRRIGFISWIENFALTGKFREDGYQQGMMAAGIDIDPEWIVRDVDSPQTGVVGIRHFLALPSSRRPTAVICASDQIAMGAIYAAKEANLVVGRDIALTGYDDSFVARYLYPSLTSVSQPIDLVGEWVVRLLLQQIHGQPIEQTGVLLKPKLVVRESSQYQVV